MLDIYSLVEVIDSLYRNISYCNLFNQYFSLNIALILILDIFFMVFIFICADYCSIITLKKFDYEEKMHTSFIIYSRIYS